MTTRRQHHVWCHYLEGWSRENNQVCCLRNGNLFSTNPKNIMLERDFYKLAPLSKEDIQMFAYWMKDKCEPPMRETNQGAFNAFAKIANGNEIIQNMKSATDAEKAYARSWAIEAEEKLHQEIEKRALPVINDLRQERLDFLNDQAATMNFFHFIAHQYFRTKRMREIAGEILKTVSPDYDFSRLRHVFCYCFANNFGGSLFVDRKKLDIVFLKNRNNEFITGDQPIVNLAHKETLEHDDVALYYPLAPRLAVTIAFKNFQCTSMEVSTEIAKRVNETIAFTSTQFLVAASEGQLRQFINKPCKRPDVLSFIA